MNAEYRTSFSMLVLAFCVGARGQTPDPLDQWEIVARPPIELRGLAYKDGAFVGVGIHTNMIVSTNGGADWFLLPITLPNYPGAMAVTEGAGQFVAVGWRGSIVTSPDGLQWTQRRGDAQTQFEEYWAVTHGGAGFVAVGFNSYPTTTAIAATSLDGSHWERHTIPIITTPRNVAYGNGVYVAAGAPVSMVSTNGRDWTPINSVTAQGIAFGGGQFIATLQTSGFRSTNGRDWTSFALPALASYQEYYTANYAHGTFLAAGFCNSCPNTNRPSLLATSTDSYQWTPRIFGAEANIGPIRDIVFAEGHYYLADTWQKIWKSGAAPSSANQRKTITFDDLSPGPEAPLIPSGYEGLQWYDSRVLDAFRPVTSPGLRNGMVSPNNVASGSVIWIMTNFFDFHSAYLTAAFADQVQLRVEGFVGPTLTHTNDGNASRPTVNPWRQAYEGTYTLNPNTPTLLQLDYLGIDQVRFLADSGFVMDNVAVTVHELPTTPARADLGVVHASTIGHTFVLDPRPIGNDIRRNEVTDLLVDQTQSSGGGGVLPSVSVNWDINNQFRLTIAAPPGMKFLVRPPATSVAFRGFLWWQTPGGGGSSLLGPVAVSFAGLEGTPPEYSSSDAAALSDVHGWFGAVDFRSGRFTNNLAFTSMTIIGSVVPQHIGLGAQNFTPHVGSQLALSYTTQEENDPGRFVSLVRQTPPPRIRITSMSAQGTELFVQGQAGWTVVVESSTDLLEWTSISTNVMPFTLCPICPFVTVTDPAAKQLRHCFYRAYEFP
jgi:hypothetical protein